MLYDIDISVNYIWVDTRWKQYSTVHRKTQNLVTVRAVPRLCELYPGICLITEEKLRKNLSQGSRRVTVGTVKTEYAERKIHNNKNT
jgi:hypothetical protein